MSMIARLLAAACILPCTVSVALCDPVAGTIYVDAYAGSDNAAGTIDAPLLTIGAAMEQAADGDTIQLSAGTFQEHVTITKMVTLRGRGADSTTITAPYDGGQAAIHISATSGVTVEWFTVNRLGNDTVNWGTNTTLYGIQVVNCTTSVVKECVVEGFDIGVRIDGGSDNTVHANKLNHNGYGLSLADELHDVSVRNNDISENWVGGVLVSGPHISTTGIAIHENRIAQNWHTQINVTGSDTTVAVVDASFNYYGGHVLFDATDFIAPMFEVPEYFGGTGERDDDIYRHVNGPNVVRLDITPVLLYEDDAEIDIEPGTPGIQLGHSPVRAVREGAQAGTIGRLQEAIDSTSRGGIVHVLPGTYQENIVIDSEISIFSLSGADSTIIDGRQESDALGTVVITGDHLDFVYIGEEGSGFTVLGIDGPADTVKAALYIRGLDLGHSRFEANTFTARGDAAIYAEKAFTTSDLWLVHNIIDGQTFAGAYAGGHSLDSQYVVPNVPRPLVWIEADPDRASTSGIVFSWNTVSGTAGGLSETDDAGVATDLMVPQGNHLVWLDVEPSPFNALTSNTFSGATTELNAAVRMGGTGHFYQQNNDFTSGGLHFSYYVSFEHPDTMESIARARAWYDTVFTTQAAYASNSHMVATTIDRGIDAARTDDTVYVQPGTYAESPLIDKSIVVHAKNDSVYLANGEYFIFGTQGLGENTFTNWTDATFDDIGVDTNGSLQEAASFVNPSGTVHMLAGTYDLATTVTLDSGITVSGPSTLNGTGCEVTTDVAINTSGNVRTFNVTSATGVTVRDLTMNIGTGSANRYFRVTGAGSVAAENVIFRRGGVALSTDVRQYIDDGNDAGFGPGKVTTSGGNIVPPGSIAAGWRGSDANAATISSVADNSGNGATLVQTSALRKPTRSFVDSNYVISTSVTKYLATNVNGAIHGGNQRTLFVVFKTGNTLANAIVYKHGDHTNGMSVWTTNTSAGADITVQNSTYTGSWTVQPNTWYMAQIYFNGNDTDRRAAIALHGRPAISTSYWGGDTSMATLGTPVGTNAVVSLGARQGYTRMAGTALTANTLGDAFVGVVGEVMILNTADAAIRDKAYCALNAMWDIGSSSNVLEKDEIAPAYAGEQLEPQITDVYPNPATDDITFSVVPTATEDLHITIVNTMGGEVATVFHGMAVGGSPLPLMADVSDLANGAYMIIVRGATTQFSMPLMVQR